jgi:zinc/manganese transport system substrate-binding protein
MRTRYIFLALLLTVSHSQAALNVLACEPEWAALALELGGDKITVSSATTARQDPHRIEARPSLIARARNADVLICTGLELEVGWLPVLLQQSGNPKIAVGQPGNVEAGAFVKRLDVPVRVDRSDGDVHAAGNPHIQQNPHNISAVAVVLAKRFTQLDPSNAQVYEARLKDFSARWSIAIGRWELQARGLRGIAVIEHHKNMTYLLDWLGMQSVGTLEPKPGIEPGAAHLTQLLAQLPKLNPRLVLRAIYQDERASVWLSERAKIPAVQMPFTVGGDDKAKDLFGLFDVTISRLLAAVK